MTRAELKLHRSISPTTLRSLLKNVPKMRYVITKDGRMYAGNAHRYVHEDIRKAFGLDQEGLVCGYAAYIDGMLLHHPYYELLDSQGIESRDSYIRSPLFKKFKEAGFKRVPERDPRMDFIY